MTYTRAWDETQPLDSVFADTLSQQIRNLRDDVRERMDSLLGSGNWALDPILGTLTIAKLVPAGAFAYLRTAGSGNATVDGSIAGVQVPGSTTYTALAGVRLPNLATLTGFNTLAKVPTGGSPAGSVISSFLYQQYNTPITSVPTQALTTCTVNGALVDNAAPAFSAIGITSDAMLMVNINITGGSTSTPTFVAVKFTYTMQFSSLATAFPDIIAL